MCALLTAKQMRLQYREAANEQTPPRTGLKFASDRSTQPATKGLAHTGSKQSNKGRKGSDASANKDAIWQQCLEHTQAAAQAWQGCLHAETVEGICGCEGLAYADTRPQLMLELLYMAGLHGKTCCCAFGFAVLKPVPSLLLFVDDAVDTHNSCMFVKKLAKGYKPLIAQCRPSGCQVTSGPTLGSLCKV